MPTTVHVIDATGRVLGEIDIHGPSLSGLPAILDRFFPDAPRPLIVAPYDSKIACRALDNTTVHTQGDKITSIHSNN